ncbi:hypothetical protein [Spiroplasma endosymbiont of Panorpa germanica]
MSEDLGEFYFLNTDQAQEQGIDFESLWNLASPDSGIAPTPQ